MWNQPESAREWDAGGGAALPTRGEQQQILLALLGEARIGARAVVDLGVGSGLVAEAVLEAFPNATVVGIDSSEPMLELARERLARFGPRVQLVRHDLAEIGELALPAGRYAAVFSVQTLHHLEDARKATVIAWSAGLLDAGGSIVIVDRVAVPEPLFGDWAAVWRRVDAATPATYAEYVEELERGGDRPARVADHFAWFRDSELDAMCVHAYGDRVVLVAQKSPPD